MYSPPRMLPPRLMSTAVFVVVALIAAITVVQSESARRQHERALVASHVGDYARQLETYITRALSASYALAALVEVARGDVPDFDRVAARLLPLYPGASELLLAPNGVIQHVAPLSGNEKALGLDLLSYPSQRTEATITRQVANSPWPAPSSWCREGRRWPADCPCSWKTPAAGPDFGDSRKSSCVYPTLCSPCISRS